MSKPIEESLLSNAFPHLFKEIDESKKYNFDINKLKKASHKAVVWKSTNCGHTFEMKIYERTRSRTDCPICTGQRVLRGFNDLSTLYPELVKEWDKNNVLNTSEVTAFSHKKVDWICEQGHKWKAAIYSRTKHGNNCGICSNRKVIFGFNDRLTTNKHQLFDEWSSDNTTSLKDAYLAKNGGSFYWECFNCTLKWKATILTRINGWQKCPNCFGKSHLEGKVVVFLTQNKIDFLWNKKPLKVDGNIKRNLQIDFQLTEYPLGFEIQDYGTHSKTTDETYHGNGHWSGGKKKGPLYHELKRKLAKEQLKIDLIDIWEEDVLSSKYEEIIFQAIKSKLIKS